MGKWTDRSDHNDLKIILQSLGMILIMVGVLSVIPLLVTAYYNEDLFPFFAVSMLSLTIGIGLVRLFQSSTTDFQVKHAAISAALIYLVVSVLGALPFLFYGLSFLDAFFEAMSGWTTTGLTMIADVEVLPRSLLFWRSFMQWLGGVGIIVLLLTVLSGKAGSRLYEAEARKDRIKPRLMSTVRLIWWIYTLYTLIGIFLFFIAGMPEFDAVNHSMVALSTGGFSVKNSSLAAYGSLEIEFVGILLMLLGGINFLVHYKFLTGNKLALLTDLQVKTMMLILFISSLLVGVTSLRFSDALFQGVSALTNAGLSTTNISVLNDFSKSILTSLMIIGGSAGSTSGALKIIRVIIIFKAIYWWIKQTLLPEHAVISKKLGGIEIDQEVINEATVFSLLYLMILGGGGLFLMNLGYSGTDSMFEVAAAQGNVGLSSGITDGDMNPWGKIVLIFHMWIGRLEIIPVLVLGQSLLGFKPRSGRSPRNNKGVTW